MGVAHAVAVTDQETAAQANHNHQHLAQVQPFAIHHPTKKYGKTYRAVSKNGRHRRAVQGYRQRPQAVEYRQQQAITGIKRHLRRLQARPFGFDQQQQRQ
ncbi:hypothetical protein D3C80_1494590 [compost metagenome]